MHTENEVTVNATQHQENEVTVNMLQQQENTATLNMMQQNNQQNIQVGVDPSRWP